jgi:hypothetical protein
MANVSEKYGLKPVRKIDGSPFINAQNKYRIASNYASAIFNGDLVRPATTGTIIRHVGNTSNPVLGVFNGCFYTDPTTQKATWKNYYPGSIVASDITAFVIDDPDIVCKVDADATFAVADIFKNFSLTAVTGNTTTGLSKMQLDVSVSGTHTTYMVRAIDISQDPDNSDVSAANADVLVRINNHFYRTGTGV